jgi:hypothetical protein
VGGLDWAAQPVDDGFAQAQAAKPIDFPNARGAGDVDFGEVAADDIEADEGEAIAAQDGADLGADVAFSIGDVGGDGLAADGHVAAKLTAAGDAIDRAYRFAVEHDDPLVAVLSSGQVGLDHDLMQAAFGADFDHGVEVAIAFFEEQDAFTGFAVEGFEDGLALAIEEGEDFGFGGGDDGFGDGCGELEGVHFFVGGADTGGSVEDLGLGADRVEDVGGVEVGGVDGGVFAHEDGGEVVETAEFGGAFGEPGAGGDPMAIDEADGVDLGGAEPGPGFAVDDGELADLGGPDFVALLAGGFHHGDAAVMGGIEGGDRVDDECQFHGRKRG